jgi:hypothetical protein
VDEKENFQLFRKMTKLQPAKSEKHLRRVRRLCAALPETTEKLSHGEPTFFAAKKVFCMFANNHHNDGYIVPLQRDCRRRLAFRKC